MKFNFLVSISVAIAVSACAVSKNSKTQFLDSRSSTTELPLATNPDGSRSVGIIYAYDMDWVWQLNFRSQLSSSAIGALPAKIFWNVQTTDQNGESKQLLSKSLEIPKDFLLVGQLRTDSQPDVRKVLVHQKNAQVVFSDAASNSLFKITIAPVCNIRPSVVKDLTNTDREPCSVVESDFPNNCKESEAELLQLIKDELVTCSIAKQIHKDRGCDDLACQE